MIGFKTDRQRAEFLALVQHNPKLKELLEVINDYSQRVLSKSIIITDIFRTIEEFDALYAATPVVERPSSSPHCYWQAADLRAFIYTQAEIDQIVAFINRHFKYKTGVKSVAMCHAVVGGAQHFHIQYV